MADENDHPAISLSDVRQVNPAATKISGCALRNEMQTNVKGPYGSELYLWMQKWACQASTPYFWKKLFVDSHMYATAVVQIFRH